MRTFASVGTALFVLAGLTVAGRSQSTQPSTEPAAAESLDHGRVKFTPPADWVLRGKGDDDLSAHYRTSELDAKGNALATLSLIVTPQQEPFTDTMVQKLIGYISNKVRNDAKATGATVLTQPHPVKDERFLVKIADRTRLKNGLVDDRIRVYRQEGRTLLAVVCEAYSESAQKIAEAHEVAEQMLLGTSVAGEITSSGNPSAANAGTVTILGKARLRITSPPQGWRERKTDAASGTVVTYSERGGENGMIVISLSPLHQQAKTDPKIRDMVIDELLAGEQASLQVPGAKETAKSERIGDDRFLRKTRRRYDVDGVGYQVVSRQLVVGNALVSVASLAPDERAEEIDKLADDAATSIKPTGR